MLAPFLQHPTDDPDKIASAAYRVIGGTEVSKFASATNRVIGSAEVSMIALAAYLVISSTELEVQKRSRQQPIPRDWRYRGE